MIRTLVALSVFTVTVFAQGHVAPENMYQRVFCIVPMVGDGTPANPRRPMFVPVPPSLSQLQAQAAVAAPTGEPTAPVRSGILAFQYQVSDDGNFAFVEFVGADQQALSAILKSVDPNVKVFERNISKKLDIENAFQKHKKNFTLDNYVPARVF